MDENKIGNTLDLGFAIECDAELLVNSYFPSKIGGKPAWLELENLPSLDDLKCENCSEILIFLLQVYASVDDKPECFHRTLYIFVCRNESCCIANSAKNIKVFRSQLPRENKFFNFNPPGDKANVEAVLPVTKLCRVCGCRGPYVCSKCKKVCYCSTQHQRYDWKNRHKAECNPNMTPSDDHVSMLLFHEFEIELDSEVCDLSEMKEESIEVVEKRNEVEYNKYLSSEELGELKNVSESELMNYCNPSIEDIQFDKFKKEIAKTPHQVLRYQRGGKPLWITKNTTLKAEDLQNCDRCGAKRIFEFQIMPQLLNHLKDSTLDWGIIAVYTCENSCDTAATYVREFAYKQDIVQ